MGSLPVIYHEAYEVDIGPHVFPTAKYRLIRTRLLAEGVINDDQLQRSEPASDAEVGLVHTSEYIRKINTGDFTLQEAMLLEVPFSPALRDASWLCAGGTSLCGRVALAEGQAVHLGGGFHHAFPDHGEGFCLINDVAIAVQVLRNEGALDRAIVIDCDVHHGNGTAAIFSREPKVFTFSMHQEHNYPAWKPPGDLDIGLADGTSDAEYLALLEKHLPSTVADHRPDMAFYLAGADPYREDQLGGLGLSLDGLRRRDELVLGSLNGAGVPVVVVLAGGYALRTDDTIAIHCETVRAVARVHDHIAR
jgi:acetoin utilization deacetylase AcuC-like enzyme